MIKSSKLWLENKIHTTGKYKNNVWNCWSKLHLLFHLLNSKMFRRDFTEIPGTAKKCKFSGFFDGMNMMIFHLDKEDKNWFLLPNFLFRSFLYHQLTAFANILAPIQTLPQCQPGYWFPLENHNPAIFSVLPGTEKLNKSLQADKKALVIPTCCTCLTITLILIPELPANTS